MPNHCSNILTVKGKVQEFKKNCIVSNTDKEAWDKFRFDFDTIVPCKDKENVDWHKAEWGTRCNSYDLEITSDTPNKLQFFFNTAWTPANEKFVEAMVELYPNLEFTWYYYEPGEGFAGYYDIFKGDIINHYYESNEDEYKEIEEDIFGVDSNTEEEEVSITPA